MSNNPVSSIFAKLLDTNGVVITDSIRRVKYVYAEEEDDQLDLEIVTDSVDLIDDPRLSEFQEVDIVWGFVPYPFVKRRIMIQELKPRLSDQGVILTLKGTDRAALLKQIQGEDIYEDTTLEDVVNDKAEKLGMEVKILFPSARRESDELGRTTVAARDRSATWQKIVIPKIIQAGRSDQQVINEAKGLSGDDMVVEGRDNQIIVKKRDYNQKPIATYEYKRGKGSVLEMDITPDTRKSSSTQTEITSTAWNPEEKVVREMKVEPNQTTGANLSKFSKSTSGVTQEDKTKARLEKIKASILTDEEAAADFNSPGYSREALIKSYLDPDSKQNEMVYLEFGRPVESKLIGGYRTAARDKTAYVIGTTMPKAMLLSPEEEAILQGSEAQGLISKFPIKAELTVEGNPDLESGKVVKILGISNRYSGNWYVTKVTHTISDDGYLCELEIGKTGPDSVDSFDVYYPADGDINEFDDEIDARQNLIDEEDIE